MSNRLCVIPGCREVGAHLDDCTSDRCRGCLPRYVEDGLVCANDRIRLAAELAEIPTLYEQLAQPVDSGGWQTQMRRPLPTTDPDRLPPWVWLASGDELVAVMPAGVTRVSNQARVSGTREQPAPVSLDLLDLTGAARHGSRAPHARGVLGDDDQTGYLPVATELDTWVRDWCNTRGLGEHLPVPTVPELVRWLAHRLPWACDHHDGIDEFAVDLGTLRVALRRVLELDATARELCDGVACKSCDRMNTLYREGGLVTCGYCGMHYSEQEYRNWTKLEAPYALSLVRDGEVEPNHPDELWRMAA